ncbi:MAG TPA: efflux transporter periplasmic adaptor subunit, partial [Paraburkholderia sp.]
MSTESTDETQPRTARDDAAPSAPPPAATPATRRRRHVAPLALAALAAALLMTGIVPRLRASTALAAQTAANQQLDVVIVRPTVAPAQQDLLLPGSITPYAEASVYARTSGYISQWNADIGAHVKAGQR